MTLTVHGRHGNAGRRWRNHLQVIFALNLEAVDTSMAGRDCDILVVILELPDIEFSMSIGGGVINIHFTKTILQDLLSVASR